MFVRVYIIIYKSYLDNNLFSAPQHSAIVTSRQIVKFVRKIKQTKTDLNTLALRDGIF